MSDPTETLRRNIQGRKGVTDREVQTLLDTTRLMAQRYMKALEARGLGKTYRVGTVLCVSPVMP